MISGITVKLYVKKETGKVDGFNRPIYEEIPVEVENVLVAPSSYDDVVSTLNLTGKKAVYSLAIPKGDNHEWENAKVEFFGEFFHVFTPVIQGIEDIIPLQWNKKVMVERYE